MGESFELARIQTGFQFVRFIFVSTWNHLAINCLAWIRLDSFGLISFTLPYLLFRFEFVLLGFMYLEALGLGFAFFIRIYLDSPELFCFMWSLDPPWLSCSALIS